MRKVDRTSTLDVLHKKQRNTYKSVDKFSNVKMNSLKYQNLPKIIKGKSFNVKNALF